MNEELILPVLFLYVTVPTLMFEHILVWKGTHLLCVWQCFHSSIVFLTCGLVQRGMACKGASLSGIGHVGMKHGTRVEKMEEGMTGEWENWFLENCQNSWEIVRKADH